MQKNKIFNYALLIAIVIILWINKNEYMPNIEEEDIHIGTGYSMKKENKDIVDYRVLLSAYVFEGEDKVESVGNLGVGTTIGKTRQDRQNRNPRKFTTGFEKVFIIDEQYALYGIRNIVDIVFKHPMINLDGQCIVCKGESAKYLKLKSEGYNSSADFIYSMIKNTKEYNFWGENYSMRDIFLIIDSEGRNIVLPYIELVEGKIELRGIALFKKYHLVKILNIEESKIMNILRENNTKGMLTIQKDSKEYINCYARSSRKVKCVKNGDKYKFIIDIKFKGDVVSNQLYNGISKDLKVTKKFEEDLTKNLEEKANSFIHEMKTNYRVDCLELGRVAAAKYGRHKGVDWNEVVCNSDIEVNVSVHVDKVGRGEY